MQLSSSHPSKLSNRWIDLAAVMLILSFMVLSAPYHKGFTIYYDSQYAKFANYVAQHGMLPDQGNFLSARLGYLVEAIVIKVFGFSEYITFTPMAELAIFYLLFYALLSKIFDRQIALVALAFTVFSQNLWFNSSMVGVDIIETVLINAMALFCLLQTKAPSDKSKINIVNGIVAAILLVAAVACKESVVFYIPFLAILFGISIFNKHNLPFWASFFVASVLGGFSLLLLYHHLTGDAFIRLHLVVSGPASSDSNYMHASRWLLLQRLTYQPLQFMLEEYDFGILVLLSIPLFLKQSASPQVRLAKIFLLSTLGMWWLGSQSIFHLIVVVTWATASAWYFKSSPLKTIAFTVGGILLFSQLLPAWNPVALVHRLWLPLLFPLAMCAALGVKGIVETTFDDRNKRQLTFLLLFLLILTICSLFLSNVKYAYHGIPHDFKWAAIKYTAVVGLIIISLHYKAVFATSARKAILLAALLATYIYMPIVNLAYTITDHPESEYSAEKKMFAYLITKKPARVITEANLVSAYGMYTNFKIELPLQSCYNVGNDSIATNTYLLINKSRLKFDRDQMNNRITESTIYTVGNQAHICPIMLSPESYGFEIDTETATHQIYHYRISGIK